MDLMTIGIGALALLALSGGKKRGLPNAAPPLPGTQAGNALAQLAAQVEADLLAHGSSYDHSLLTTFQRAANIVVDGLYGPESALALARALGHTAPPPIYSGASSSTLPPITTPIASSDELDAVRKLANDVAQEINAKHMSYDHNLVKRFQQAARFPAKGIDGLYGPATAGAVAYYTDSVPPAPLYKGADGTYSVKPYTPPT